MKIYLAREGDSRDYQDNETQQFWGKVLIFYDTPKWMSVPDPVYDPYDASDHDDEPYTTHTWGEARQIGEAPSYMFQDVTPEEYVVLYSEDCK